MEKTNNITLHDLNCCKDLQTLTTELELVTGMIADDFEAPRLTEALADLRRLFVGEYPGYQASNTEYHDLEHTLSVVLATARLLHGMKVEKGANFTGRQLLVGLLAAMFHDTGLIQTEEERQGTGAHFTVGHEDRSVRVATAYLQQQGFSEEEIADCSRIILATTLHQPFADPPLRNQTVARLARALASADLLAQMADRAYLDKLPRLYLEFREGGVPGYGSELDILQKTELFHEEVARPRLKKELGGTDMLVRGHFRERWGIDRDLYAESIANNLFYISHLNSKCGNTLRCYHENLRRTGNRFAM